MNSNISDSFLPDFGQALAFHRAGRLEEAAAGYRAVLATDPTHADAMHLLGLVEFQSKNYVEAERWVRGAIRLREGAPDFHFNLGLMLSEQGRYGEAKEELRRAAALSPKDAAALGALGNVLAALGESLDAEAVYRGALDISPHAPVLHFNLGNLLAAQQRYEEARASFSRALELRPDYLDAMLNIGAVWRALNNPVQAEACFRKVLELSPGHTLASNNLGVMLRDLGRLEEAEVLFRGALQQQPDYAEAWNNLAATLDDLGNLEAAESCLRRALELRPGYAHAYSNLGKVLLYSRPDEAVAAYREAISLQPDYAEAHSNLGVALLLAGDFRDGWAEYEYRLQRQDASAMYGGYSGPLWRGEDLNGTTLLLHAEQGLGDTVQFIRFAKVVASRGGRVIVECQPALKRLLTSVAGTDGVYAKGEPLPRYDYHLPLMSLPYWLGIDEPKKIPADIPYLLPEPELVEKWGARIGSFPGLKVGLVWAGDPRKHERDAALIDRRRSIKLADYGPLFSIGGVHFFSLQKGEAGEQASDCGMRLVNFMPEIDDFSDTAAVLAQLDLVISVDTSVAHVAAAMGLPVWLLSRHDGCWRWMRGREDTPWYPTMRLFRQKRKGEWQPVIAQLAEALRQLVSSHAAIDS